MNHNLLISDSKAFLSQTLTGKEIEIDIEPTDKVYDGILHLHLDFEQT